MGSNRLPSSKLSKRSSSSPPSSPRPPAASSRPSVHSIDLNDPSLVSGKMIHHEHHETANDKVDSPRKQEQPQYSVLYKESIDHVEIDQSTEHPVSKGQYMKQESQELTLSEDSKRRARDLLRLLTDQIETRSRTLSLNPTCSPKTLFDEQYCKKDELLSPRSSTSSHDLLTERMPPKPRRYSSTVNKKFNQNDKLIPSDTE